MNVLCGLKGCMDALLGLSTAWKAVFWQNILNFHVCICTVRIVLVQPVFRQQFFKNSRNYEIWLLNENESTKSGLYHITIEIPLIKSQKFNLECMFNYHKKLESSNIFELLLSKHRLHQKDFNEHFKNVQLSSEELNMRSL